MSNITQFADTSCMIDLDALYSSRQKGNGGEFKAKSTEDVYRELDSLLADTVALHTCDIRSGADGPNSSLEKIHTNMAPYPKIHHMITSYASLSAGGLKNAFGEDFTFCKPYAEGKWASLNLMANTKTSSSDLLGSFNELKGSQYKYCGLANPERIHVVAVDGGKEAASVIGVNTCVKNWSAEIVSRFDCLWNKRAYAHWFVGNGMM